MGPLNRRQLLGVSLTTLLGHIAMSQEVTRPISSHTKRVALLYKYLPITTHYQGKNPDCTAHAAAIAVEILNGIEHVLFDAPAPREVRVAYLHAKSVVRGQEGASVEDVIKVLQKGFLWKTGPYNFNDHKKLRGYASKLDARIETVNKITSWDQAANAIKSLQPIVISSNMSFKGAKLDKDGFIRPSRKKWGHAWCLIGIDDRFHRPGGLLLSSWGETWPNGVGSRHNQPKGSAWVDADVIDTMLSEYGKSYAISDLQAIKNQDQDQNRKVIFYSSTDCPPCQAYKPIIAQFPEIVTVEDNHNVSPVPQVWIVRDNEIIATLTGLRTKQELANFLEN